MKIRAEMGRACGPILPSQYQVDKVVELPNAEFAAFMIQPLDRYEFIKQNKVEAHQGDGFDHCLLVLGDDSVDGVLVQCGSHDRASWTAYIAGARDVVQAQLDRAMDFVIQGTERTASGSWCVYREELEEKFGLTVRDGSGLDAMLKEALERRPEVASVVITNGAIETTFHPKFCAALRGSADVGGQINVLKVEPGRPPEETIMPNTLEAFQAAVGGYIEVLGLDSDTVLVCNEEGKLVGLPPNRRVCGDTIAGTFLIAGSADGEFCSLSDEDAAHYAKEFEQPMPVYGDPDEPTQWEFHVF